MLAGGQSLVPLMKLRLVAPDLLIDINKIKDLSYIVERTDDNDDDGGGGGSGIVSIGALTRYKSIIESSLIRERFPILVDAVESIADTQIRNRGTVGGNVCHADPASDLSPALIALKARFKVFGSEGDAGGPGTKETTTKKARTVRAEDFFLDVFTPNLGPAEILGEVNIPKPSSQKKSRGTYVKFTEVSGGFAIVGVALQLTLGEREGNGRGLIIQDAGIGLASVGPTPIRARHAEELLLDKQPTRGLIEEAAREVSKCVSESASDVQASSRYRKHLAGVLFKRAALRTVSELGVKL